MSNRIKNDDQWLNMLQECRSSGLTDRAWCAMQGIHHTEAAPLPYNDQACIPCENSVKGSAFEVTVRIVMPSGIK